MQAHVVCVFRSRSFNALSLLPDGVSLHRLSRLLARLSHIKASLNPIRQAYCLFTVAVATRLQLAEGPAMYVSSHRQTVPSAHPPGARQTSFEPDRVGPLLKTVFPSHMATSLWYRRRSLGLGIFASLRVVWSVW